MRSFTIFGLCALMALSTFCSAQTVIFSGTDGSLDFNTASDSYTDPGTGLTVTLSANDGTVNATASGLGINDSFSDDDTDGIDSINLVEILTMSFNSPVTFDSITLADVGVNDALDVSIAGDTPIRISSSGQFLFSDPRTVQSGETVTLTAAERNAPTPNNGVNITQFTVTVIPEPGTMIMVLGGAGVLAMLRRRFR